ncbi:hypothetical protein [Roseibacillus ishigakijimensis]|uniref:Uncharacterized protein n=1 Tax=Roseibacillus ishigakijimensis TaxID=454146 RepID=A0A934VGT5_9BACT|nr:hypothetical protein [Roseibacillus ishigakijimensis]MBK1833208.1 hypothetical protein [Roseibacillus ishigakijimensis]
MKLTSSLLTGAALFLVTGALGWTLAPGSDHSSKEAVRATEHTPTKSTRSTKSRARQGAPSPSLNALKGIRSARSEGERMRGAIALARSLPIEEAARWLDEGLFSQREGFAQTLFIKILQERWQREDPNGYLVWQIGNGKQASAEQLARLADEDPERLFAALEQTSVGYQRSQYLATLAQSRPELVLKAIGDGILLSVEPHYYEEIVNKLAEGNRDLLESSLADLPLSLATAAETALIKADLQKDFANTLPRLYDHPQGIDLLLNDYQFARKNISQILAHVGDFPENWKESLVQRGYLFGELDVDTLFTTNWQELGFSESHKSNILGYRLGELARSNPDQLLAVLKSGYQPEANWMRSILSNLISSRPEDAVDMLEPYLDEEGRQYAKQLLTQNSGGASIGGRLGGAFSSDQYEPGHQREQIAQMSPAQLQHHSIYAYNWSPEQHEEFAQSFQDAQGEERLRLAAAILNSDNLHPEVTTEAIEYALAHPEIRELANWQDDSTLIQAASQHAMTELQRDPAEASAWLENLPAGEVREWSLKNLAINWQNLDPDGAREWVAALPTADRQAVEAFLAEPPR